MTGNISHREGAWDFECKCYQLLKTGVLTGYRLLVRRDFKRHNAVSCSLHAPQPERGWTVGLTYPNRWRGKTSGGITFGQSIITPSILRIVAFTW